MIASMSSLVERKASLVVQARQLLSELRDWPWFDTLRTLRQRFKEDRLGLTAGSLTWCRW